MIRQFAHAYPRQISNVAQWLIALGVVSVLAWLVPRAGAKTARHAWRSLGEIAQRPRATLLLPAALSALVSLTIAAIAGPPLPRVHDEFAHLLAADTFAHGRLTNPTPLDWQSFETMHVLVHPTYMSKFGPAQGAVLAVGQVLFQRPWLGLVLLTAGACAALTWCVRGFMSARWALFGGLLAALHPEILIWSREFWGGNMGVLGGSLVLGALIRLDVSLRNSDTTRKTNSIHRAQIAAILAIGLAFLANARPYEAAIWGLIISLTFAYRLFRSGQPVAKRIAQIVGSASLVLLPVAGFMGYYNWRITGNAAQLPYTLHVSQYMSVPLFFWQPLPPLKQYSNPQFTALHEGFERNTYFLPQTTPSGWLRWAGYKIYFYAELHLTRNLLLSLGLITLLISSLRFRRDGRRSARADDGLRLALVAAAIFIVGYAIIPWFEHHYSGASLALLFVIALKGLRRLRLSNTRRGRPVGRAIIRFAIVSCLLVVAFIMLRERQQVSRGFALARQQRESELLRKGGKHLVFVHYAADHDFNSEWVYNRADLPEAAIIWARDLGDAQNSNVIRDYGAGRTIWTLYPDDPVPRMHSVEMQ